MKRERLSPLQIILTAALTQSLLLAGCSSDGDDADTGASGGESSSTGGNGSGSGGNDSGMGGAAAGTGGSAAGTGGSSTELPADASQAAIEAFLDAETHRNWIGDPEIRAQVGQLTTHGTALRVFFNQAAVDSIAAGPDTSQQGAMVVKEIYDGEGVLAAKAVRWKTGEGDSMNDWTLFCSAPEGSDLCTGGSVTLPVFGTGMSTECGFCHGSASFFAKPPM